MTSQTNGIIPEITKKFTAIKVHDKEIRETTVEVCTESRIVFTLNDSIVGDLSITPLDMEAFAVGYLICEGYIGSMQEIEKVSITLPNINVTTRNTSDVIPGQFSKNSSGGSCRELLPDGLQNPLPDGLFLSGETIIRSMDHVNEYSVIWKRTGGMHCCLIIQEEGTVVCGVEDMGRHTTVDKAVGMALIQNVDLSRCYLVCSGRLPVDMVAKAYRAGISVVVSNNAAFAGGIEFAKKMNMTLAGFVRPPNMTIYTGAHRIRFD